MLKEEGASTLGGRKIWFDSNVNRLNTEERGQYLGEFKSDEKIIVFYKNGTFETTSYSLENRYDDDVAVIEKFDPEKIWSLVYFEAEQNYFYLKRFKPEEVTGSTSIVGDHEKSEFTAISDEKRPRFEISFKGKHKDREPETVEAEEFIGEKSFRARGKRLTTYEVKSVTEIDPLPDPEEEEKGSNGNEPEFEVTQTDEDGNQIQLKL